jgi:ABC-2 type transport system permease protein
MYNIKKSLKEILTITKYSILMFFREKTAIFFSLFFPVMIMLIFGFLNMGEGVKFKVGVVDEANNDQSRKVLEVLKEVEVFQVSEGSKDEKIAELKDAKLSYVLVLPEEFGVTTPMIQRIPTSGVGETVPTPQRIDIFYDQSQNVTTVQVGFTVFDKIIDGMTHQIARVPKYYEINQISIGGDNLRYIDFMVPGIVAMSVMQLSIFAVTGAIVSWRERGILKRLLATPIQPAVIIFSQIVSRVIITFLQAGLLIALGIFLFQLNVVGSIGLVIGLIVGGGLIFLAMGFALSGLASSQNVVAALANLFVFPQMMLSGIFFPRDSFPEWMVKITNFFPLTYFSDAMREVMVKGATLQDIQGSIIGLLVWAVIMFFLAVRLFRWE